MHNDIQVTSGILLSSVFILLLSMNTWDPISLSIKFELKIAIAFVASTAGLACLEKILYRLS